MLILRSPKGWTGPISTGDLQLLNSFASHQVPLPKANSADDQLKQLSAWLLSYDPATLIPNDSNGLFAEEIMRALPTKESDRLGFAKEAYAEYKPLDLGDWKKMAYKKGEEIR